MKKKFTFVTLLILAIGILLGSFYQEETPAMKLINTQSGFVVAEFTDGKVRFGDRFLEAEMKEDGIRIPPAKRADFGGKETVSLDDPLFQKAFVEIYVPLTIASSAYRWE